MLTQSKEPPHRGYQTSGSPFDVKIFIIRRSSSLRAAHAFFLIAAHAAASVSASIVVMLRLVSKARVFFLWGSRKVAIL
jgi:hypothetical protein